VQPHASNDGLIQPSALHSAGKLWRHPQDCYTKMLCYSFSYFTVISSMKLNQLGKPLVVQLPENYAVFYRIRRFITVFARALHMLLTSVRLMQPMPSHPIPLGSILILSFHLCIGLHSGFVPSGVPVRMLYGFVISICVLHAMPFHPP
jgi:hypothetical protein